jgi:DNA polymerase III alpha subunit
MINLRIFTQHHFDFSDRGYGKTEAVVARLKALGQTHAAITDSTTFGHVAWFQECVKQGLVPILGAELRVPLEEQGTARCVVLARNNPGLEELYSLTSAAASDAMTLEQLLKSSKDVIKLTGTLRLTKPQQKLLKGAYADISPSTPPEIRAAKLAGPFPIVAVSDNRYPSIEDRPSFSLFGGSVETHPQHILSEREARSYIGGLPDSAYTVSHTVAQGCKVSLPKAVNLTVKGDLEKLCRGNIKARIGRWTKAYEARLALELRMIGEKKFESYFLIISDMVRYAKKHMVVGPARGSAAGSLVCFLAYITDIDPLQHGLLFERFIDVTEQTCRTLISISRIQSEEWSSNTFSRSTALITSFIWERRSPSSPSPSSA